MTANKKNILILSIVFILIILLFICMLFVGKIPMNDEYTVGNTAGNLNNSGYFCESDGKVYFANAYDNYALYSMNPDETEMKKLSGNSVSSINAGGNYLYYYMESGKGGEGLGYMVRTAGIYRSKKNGRQASCLKRAYVVSMQLCGNHLYYEDYVNLETVLSKIKIDKSEDSVVADYVINPACYENGRIYFHGTVDDHALYALDTATDEIISIWAEGNLWNPIVADGYVYYMDVSDNYSLCRYSLSDDVVEILSHDRVDFFNLAGGYLYYQTASKTEPALKRMLTDGSENVIVAEGIYENINATSQYVYFNQFGENTPVYQTNLYGEPYVTTFDAAAQAAAANQK